MRKKDRGQSQIGRQGRKESFAIPTGPGIDQDSFGVIVEKPGVYHRQIDEGYAGEDVVERH
jgi:hypothetical protein